ncbi:MAG: pseudouridine synthase, partial [Bacteroidales bacterium]
DRPRPARSFDRGDRPARSFDRSDRPARSFDRSDRPARSFDKGDGSDRPRPARSFDRGDGSDRPRPARSFDRGDRPARSFDRSDRPARSFDRSDRPARSFDKDETPKKSFEDKDDSAEKLEGDTTSNYSSTEFKEEAPSRPQPQSYTPKPRQPRSASEEGVRLNKFIANSGICSRREADDYITAGLVSVNGAVITELGTRVYQNDTVKFNDEKIKGEEKVYILMNKPKDYVTTLSDPHAEKTVMDLIEGKCAERVYPVGRLDKATTGVLLLTNDGDLADKLSHPSFEKKKIYHVFLDINFKTTDFQTLLNGIQLDDGFIQADTLSYIDEDKSQVGIEIHSGRNRIVRRVFEHLGYKIKKLDRVYFAGLTKKNLRRGQWRFLTDQEIAMLKMSSFE